MDLIEKKLLENKIRPSIRGFEFLHREIQLIRKGLYSVGSITKIHEHVAAEFKTTWENVNMCIVRALKNAGIKEFVSDFVARIVLEIKGK